MTTEQRKEELRKKFEEYFWFDGILSTRETRRLVPFNRDNAFDFFYSEIENRDEQIEYHAGLSLKNANAVRELQTKLQRLEEIIKAANAVIVNANYENYGTVKFEELVNAYNKLKSKLPSGI